MDEHLSGAACTLPLTDDKAMASDAAEYSVWSVRAQDATAEGVTFDAQLLFHDVPNPSLLAPPDVSSAAPTDRYFNHPVPFTRPLPNRPFTLVVRAHGASPILVSVEAHDSTGPTGSGSWCRGSCAIIVRTPAGTISSSLPDDAE